MTIHKACLYLLALSAAVAACTAERTDSDAATDVTRDTTYRIDSVIVPQPRLPRGVADEADDRSRLLPVDEAAEAPDFFAYRMRLIEAVGARDTSALFALMSNDIRVSFGAENGQSAFREMWRPAQADSELWRRLARVLGGGGVYEEDSLTSADGRPASARFTAPYYFARFPGEEFDAFQHGVLLGPDIPVRERPEPGAPILERLSYAIVRTPDFFAPRETASGDWIRIELDENRFGFVPAEQIESPVGYRALFNRIDGAWTMTAFVAGD